MSAAAAAPDPISDSLGQDLLERCRREPEFERRYDASTWSVLGEGQFGCVGRILDRDLGQMVALKLLWRLAPDMRVRIQAEVQNAQRICSEVVVQVHTVSFGRQMAWLQMELVDGHNLETELETRSRERRPFSTREAIGYAISAAVGLAHAHAVGVLHRDVKPSNFLIPKAGPCVVKLGDFGLSRHRDAAHLTATGEFPGTPAYAAPEIFDGMPASRASDVYSLGIVIYRILANGRMPFALSDHPSPGEFLMAHKFEHPQRLRRHCSELSTHLEDMVMRALAKAVRLRPAACELRDALLRERRGLQSGSLSRPSKRWWRPKVAPIFAAVVVASLAGALAQRGRQGPRASLEPVALPVGHLQAPVSSAAPTPAAAGASPGFTTADLPGEDVRTSSRPRQPRKVEAPRPTREEDVVPTATAPSADPPSAKTDAEDPGGIEDPPTSPASPVERPGAPTPAAEEPPAPPSTSVPPAPARAFVTLPTVMIDAGKRLRGRVLFEVEPSAPTPGRILGIAVWLVNEGEDTLRIQDLGVVVASAGDRRGRPSSPLTREVKPGQRGLLARIEDVWRGHHAWSVDVFVELEGGPALKGAMRWE